MNCVQTCSQNIRNYCYTYFIQLASMRTFSYISVNTSFFRSQNFELHKILVADDVRFVSAIQTQYRRNTYTVHTLFSVCILNSFAITARYWNVLLSLYLSVLKEYLLSILFLLVIQPQYIMYTSINRMFLIRTLFYWYNNECLKL